MVNCVLLDACQITWQFEPILLMRMEVFQNIYFWSCDLLGTYIWMQKCKIMFFAILRHDLEWSQQDHRIISNFFITIPHLQNTKTIKNTCDVLGTIRYCLLKFKKLSWFPNFWVIFGSQIFDNGGQKKIFFGKWCFSTQSNIIYT